MNRGDARSVLEHLAELLPAHAPDIDDATVDKWLGTLHTASSVDEAIAAVEHIAVTFPSPDRPYWPHLNDLVGAIQHVRCRAAIRSAIQAVREAPDHPRMSNRHPRPA